MCAAVIDELYGKVASVRKKKKSRRSAADPCLHSAFIFRYSGTEPLSQGFIHIPRSQHLLDTELP